MIKGIRNTIAMINMLATMSHTITMTITIVIKVIVNDDYGNSTLKLSIG